MRPSFAALLYCTGFLLIHTTCLAAPEWQHPTPEELSMTSDPAAPGAAAIILFKEERSDDNLQLNEFYVREKILTQAALNDADIVISYMRRNYSVNAVSGRTIHKDGTVIPFTGKPFDKLIARGHGMQYQAKVFSMPDVQVGSILEYRYSIRYDDSLTIPATWMLQGEYFIRKEHFRYVPLYLRTNQWVTDNAGHTSRGISYVCILPPGVAPHYVQVPGAETGNGLRNFFEMDATAIKAVTLEEHQPPIEGLSYRVLFYNDFFANADKFWKVEGKEWSKHADHFIGPAPAVALAVSQVTAAGDTPEQKLHKIYNTAMTIENTDFTRQHSTEEEKAVGENPVKTSEDVWTRKRGNSDQIAMLFVGMVRAAGFKAYLMAVTNRDSHLFDKNLPSTSQLDDDIAIVQIDGKDRFFDPGSPYCTYGQLHWKHSGTMGLRQNASETELATTPPMDYRDSREEWAARLQMDKTGSVAGIVQVRYTGAPALGWRQAILKGDMTEQTRRLEDALQRRLPGGMNVKMKKLVAPADSSQPLMAIFDISGPIATNTAKRMFVSGQIFQSNDKPPFVSPVRVNAIYFDYPYVEVDDVQITPAAGVSVESMPKPVKQTLQQSAFYVVSSEMKGRAASIVRQFAIGSVIFNVADYPELKSFYGKVNISDQEQLVFRADASALGN